jgi:hypothetical protein
MASGVLLSAAAVQAEAIFCSESPSSCVLLAAALSVAVVGCAGCTDSIAVMTTLIFQCVENERRPAPFDVLSFESASLMKLRMVFCAEAGVAGGVSAVALVDVLSVAPEVASSVDAGEVPLPAAVLEPVSGVFDALSAEEEAEPSAPAAEVDVFDDSGPDDVALEDEPLEADVEPEPPAVLAPDIEPEPLVELPLLAPAYPYAEVTFREYVRLSRYAAI